MARHMKRETTVATLALATLLGAQQAPVELGKVRWNRSFEKATKLAARSERPILLLFQEVPG